MKLTLTLILVSVFSSFAADLYSQNTKLNLEYKNEKIVNLLRAIEDQSEYRFFYNEEINLKESKSINKSNASIREVLDQLFENTEINYEIVGRQIILRSNAENFSSQQQKSVSGKVTDASGQPLPGVTIVVKGTTNGTITDPDGRYSLKNVPGNAVLQISFVGMKSQEISLSGKSEINVVLQEETIGLEEVVAVGYGTQSKRNITGSIQSVDTEELTDMPVTTVAQKLQGKLSGVQINQTTGKPGEGMKLRVRGQASLAAGNDPLYVVDGFPIVGDINTINPNEIESISVLKDAASTSLYGSRAANGVILITTKRAKAGKTTVGVNVYYGWQRVPDGNRPDMMNGTEFAQFKKESYEDLGVDVPEAFQNPEQYGKGYNWYDAMLNTAPIQDYSISVSSGKENFSTSAVLGYFRQEGVLIESSYERYSVRINSEFKINDQIRVGVNVAPSHSINKTPGSDGIFWSGGGLIAGALQSWPIYPYKNEDGTMPLMYDYTSLGGYSTPNYYRSAHEIKNKTKDTRLLANAYVQYEPIEGLSLKSSINFDYGMNMYRYVQPSTASADFAVSIPTTSKAIFRDRQYYSCLNENTVTYKKSIGEHNFEVLGGYTVQKYRSDLDKITVSDFPDDRVPTISSAKNIVRENDDDTYDDIQEWSLISYLARLNYNYKNRYLLTAAVRRDGSSRFGEDDRWGVFPSVSAGWIISEEGFMPKIKAVSLLKLRGGYGVVGNNNIGNYTQYPTVSLNNNAIFNNTVASGTAVTSMGNSLLSWEQTREFDFGLDMELFNRRLSVSYDFYTKKTKDLLYEVEVPQESGFESFMGNIGKLKFWGHEITLNSKNLTREFTWNTNFNIAFTDNKVLSLSGTTDRIYSGFSDSNITREGHRIGQFWGMVQDGVYDNQEEFDNSPKANASEVGTIKFKDINGDGEITNGGDDDDRTVIGDPTPDFTFGMTNNFTYKNFDLSVVISGAYGNDILNALEEGITNLDGCFNVLKEVKDRWRSEDNPGKGKYGKTTSNTATERSWRSTRFISDASFLSIKNVTLGYTVPAAKLKFINNLRVYVSVQQLYTFTGYDGSNPEVSVTYMGESGSDNSVLNLGSDFGSYPVPRTITFGINLGL